MALSILIQANNGNKKSKPQGDYIFEKEKFLKTSK